MQWNSFQVFVRPIEKYQVDSEWGELLFFCFIVKRDVKGLKTGVSWLKATLVALSFSFDFSTFWTGPLETVSASTTQD